jgi:hypothetical protein
VPYTEVQRPRKNDQSNKINDEASTKEHGLCYATMLDTHKTCICPRVITTKMKGNLHAIKSKYQGFNSALTNHVSSDTRFIKDYTIILLGPKK